MQIQSISGIFFLALLLLGCQNESKQESTNLVGFWEIQEAYRNGQFTESLDELFFEFFEDGTMRTNITGIPDDATYTFSKNKIEQRESDLDIDYTIQNLSDSTLNLTTSIRDFNFRFLLVKRIPQE
ncbi:MAG: hypothetical protein HRU40_05305 [Saprospiraceae bacterium]|nr:hypothetical protein [Saprospiraceae bacterium]